MRYIIMTILHYFAIGTAWKLFQVTTLGEVVPVDGLQVIIATLLSIALTLLFLQHSIIRRLSWKLMTITGSENKKLEP